MKDHHAIARTVAANVRANGGDGAGGFVAEDAGSGMGSGGNFLEVGAADAAGMDADENFFSANFGDRNSFRADVVHAVVDGGQHGRRDRACVRIERILSGYGH